MENRRKGGLRPPKYHSCVNMSYNIMIWNARGVANAGTQSIIKHMIRTHRVSILAIIEPMIKPKPEFFSKRFGLQYKGNNENEQIWLFAEFGVEVDEWDISEQVLHARFSTMVHPTPFHLSIVYGKCSRAGRRPLWDKLLLGWKDYRGSWGETLIFLFRTRRGRGPP